MTEQEQRERKMTELIRASAHHSWNATNKDGKLKHRRHFESLGIKSPEELSIALQKAARSLDARSFERQPNPVLGQTERSLMIQTKIRDRQGKKHELTIILNPDRDKDGRLHGGTAYINDPKRVTSIHKLLKDEHKMGRDPNISLRGPLLSLPEKQAVKTPAYRLKDRYDIHKPTLEREKQVTPKQEAQEQQRESKARMGLLDKLQQQKPDLTKQIGDRQRDRERDRSRDLGFGR